MSTSVCCLEMNVFLESGQNFEVDVIKKISVD